MPSKCEYLRSMIEKPRVVVKSFCRSRTLLRRGSNERNLGLVAMERVTINSIKATLTEEKPVLMRIFLITIAVAIVAS